MRVDIVTLFPSMFVGPFGESIIKRAQEKGILRINLHNLRCFAFDRYHSVDDAPFGGGVGMVMKIEIIYRALKQIKEKIKGTVKVVLLSPQGRKFTQDMAKKLAQVENLILLCGHYEGVDERVREYLIDEEISIGDYVLSGGELPAMVVVDAVTRMLPGVLGSEDSVKEDSFYQGLLDYPQYTRPADFMGWKVPAVLLSGNHQEIKRWRRKKMLEKTLKKRPDLLKEANLTPEDKEWLREIKTQL
ncbi:tRNA (guanosine(37)-N1)-methyltransferase TrmD [Candidatus Aerophobetes bacterium]|nr:tRNA (guanosine(37)-N1)-methyltransferase TrmD [Candidatus Aerophobetes bacterium]